MACFITLKSLCFLWFLLLLSGPVLSQAITVEEGWLKLGYAYYVRELSLARIDSDGLAPDQSDELNKDVQILDYALESAANFRDHMSVMKPDDKVMSLPISF